MNIKAAAFAVLLVMGSMPAMAQPGWYGGGPRDGGLAPYEITSAVRSAGLTPVSRPLRVGPNYVVDALDRRGDMQRVTVDGEFGDVLRVRPVASAGQPRWSGWGPPPRPPRGLARRFDDDEMDAPRYGPPPRPRWDVPGARAPYPADVAPPPAAGYGRSADLPDASALPPPPPVIASRTGPDAPLPGATEAKPKGTHTAMVPVPLPRPRPAVEPEPAVAKPAPAEAAGAPSAGQPAAAPRVILPGGPAATEERAAAASRADATGSVPQVPAAAPPAAAQPATAQPAAAQPQPREAPPAFPPVQSLE